MDVPGPVTRTLVRMGAAKVSDRYHPWVLADTEGEPGEVRHLVTNLAFSMAVLVIAVAIRSFFLGFVGLFTLVAVGVMHKQWVQLVRRRHGLASPPTIATDMSPAAYNVLCGACILLGVLRIATRL